MIGVIPTKMLAVHFHRESRSMGSSSLSATGAGEGNIESLGLDFLRIERLPTLILHSSPTGVFLVSPRRRFQPKVYVA